MDQLITQLEQKISSLVDQLNSAKQEIHQLRSQLAQEPQQIPPADPLISNMEGLPAADQLQLYIADSLNLSEPSNSKPKPDNEEQLSFDLDSKHPLLDLFTEAEAEAEAGAEAEAEAEAEADRSSSINNQQRNKNQKNNLRLVKLLESRYPKAFNWSNPKPLKIGIDQDITLDEELTKSKLKRALAAYTRSNRYKKCLKKTSERIGLDGKPIKPNKNRKNKAHQAQVDPKKTPNTLSKSSNDNDEYQDLSSEERMKLKLAKLTGNKF